MNPPGHDAAGRSIRPRRPRRTRVLAVSLLVMVLVGTSCESGDGPEPGPPSPTGATDGTVTPTPSSTPDPSAGGPGPDLASARVDLEEVVTLEQPLALAVRSGDDALYFAEKVGRVVAVPADGEPEVVLDMAGEVSLGAEQGLLGLAFSPDGRYLYVNYTDVQGHSHVTEFAFQDGGVQTSSRRDVLVVEQPFVNHNGGNLAFGPDGHLYIGLGDGGGSGDPDGNGQSLDTMLGKMLRISPRPSGGDPYAIPPGNPFVDTAGALPEIWAYGLRNPWRYSFDRETGDLWIGEVGQNAWEEIDVEPAGSPGGRNYGWNLFEGGHAFEGDVFSDRAVLPVWEFPTGGGTCAVTGGYVYRGEEIPELVGAYVFGDFCGEAVEAFVLRDGAAVMHRELGPVVENLASFGEDAAGELYVLSLSGPVYRLVPDGSGR